MLPNFLKSFFCFLCEDLGIYPASTNLYLRKNTDVSYNLPLKEQTISAESIYTWVQLEDNYYASNSIMGWKYEAGGYSSFTMQHSLFNEFTINISINDWSCDIQDIEGLSSSKSDLSRLSSLDEMAINNCPEMVDEISEQKLQENLSHKETRIFHSEQNQDKFHCYLWDGRIFLRNSGGSHHFAAARYIAAKIEKKIPLKSKLTIYAINPLTIKKLESQFHMFIIKHEKSYPLEKTLKAFKSTYIELDLPKPYGQAKLFLLPRNERRSNCIASVLDKFKIANFNYHLKSLLFQQNSNLENLYKKKLIDTESYHLYKRKLFLSYN